MSLQECDNSALFQLVIDSDFNLDLICTLYVENYENLVFY